MPVGQDPLMSKMQALLSIRAKRRLFTCPVCGQVTGVVSVAYKILLKWARCELCGGEFLIENDQPQALMNSMVRP